MGRDDDDPCTRVVRIPSYKGQDTQAVNAGRQFRPTLSVRVFWGPIFKTS